MSNRQMKRAAIKKDFKALKKQKIIRPDMKMSDFAKLRDSAMKVMAAVKDRSAPVQVNIDDDIANMFVSPQDIVEMDDGPEVIESEIINDTAQQSE